MVRPFTVSTFDTAASSLISAPNACAARASTWVRPPLPPLWKPQLPNTPSCSPMLWNNSTTPEPCDRGPTLVPMMPDDDSRPFSSSPSK